jgi:hypothetical protein
MSANPLWDTEFLEPGYTDTSPARADLEDFPHVASKLSLVWGYPEFADWFAEMTLIPAHRVTRQGFPPEVFEELEFLRDLYEEQLGTVSRHPLSAHQKMVIRTKLTRDPANIWHDAV